MSYNKIIKISFKKNIIDKCNQLLFVANNDIIYYDNNHLNYIYIFKNNHLKYTFYGFFKDNYFVIIFDCYDEKLNINIENKHIYLIKLNWILHKINKLSLWILDTSKLNNINTNCLLLTTRKKLFTDNVSINNLLTISDISNITINIKVCNDEIKKKNVLLNLLSIFNI